KAPATGDSRVQADRVAAASRSWRRSCRPRRRYGVVHRIEAVLGVAGGFTGRRQCPSGSMAARDDHRHAQSRWPALDPFVVEPSIRLDWSGWLAAQYAV